MDTFLLDLDRQIQAKHLLNHPFYHAWSQGRLSRECLQEYAQEYYHHVRAFPTYLSAVHSHTEDAETRKEILRNLMEEEGGSPNHPELWRQFVLSLGVTSEVLDQHVPSASIQTLINEFRSICRDQGTAEGIAALYAYESQIPAICTSKIDGLKRFYGLEKPQAWHYFSIHIAADEEHARVERALLAQHVSSQNAEISLQAAERVLNALWDFLTHMCDRYQIAC